MNTLSRFAASVSALAESGFDPVGAASLIELRDTIVAKSRAITAAGDPAEIRAIVGLVTELESLLDRLCAEHHAVTSINARTNTAAA